jgi:hypothetical protein
LKLNPSRLAQFYGILAIIYIILIYFLKKSAQHFAPVLVHLPSAADKKSYCFAPSIWPSMLLEELLPISCIPFLPAPRDPKVNVSNAELMHKIHVL